MTSNPFYNAERDSDVSDWMDGHGACKICQGEIPLGHEGTCVIYKMQTRIDDLEKALKDAPPPVENSTDAISSYTAQSIYRDWYRKTRKKALKHGK